MIELDHAVYLLNFDRILLGLSASGEWSIYYTYPCRFLHRQNFSCTVHNSPAQPKICVHYNPYSCWYKRVLTKSVSDEFLQIDRARMEYILPRIVFDEFRNIVEVPDWASLVEELASLPLESAPPGSDPPTSDPVREQWQELVIRLDNGNGVEPNGLYSYDTATDPCSDCQAHCCQTLIFPQSLPRTMTNLDYYKFCLGFPGVELGLADDVWSIVIKTSCRYLQGHRCGVYGQPERPLLCKYYDAWKCTYRVNFGLPRPPGFLRVRLEQFDWLAECFQFDQYGAIAQFPPTSAIRGHIEERWRDTLTSLDVQAAPIELK